LDPYIAASPAGAIWSCFAGGLIARIGTQWSTIAHHGLPQLGRCRWLAPLANGDVWAGYVANPAGASFALIRPKAEGPASVQEFRHGGDLGTAPPYAFGADTRGWLWRGTGDGTYVADPTQATAGVWLRLNEVDGLTDSDVN